MQPIKLDSSKTHIYHWDPNFVAMHTKEVINIAQKIIINGMEYRVRELIKSQTSRYFVKHFYYEVRV